MESIFGHAYVLHDAERLAVSLGATWRDATEPSPCVPHAHLPRDADQTLRCTPNRVPDLFP